MDGLWPTFMRRSRSPVSDGRTTVPAAACAHMPVPEKVVLPLQDLPEDSCEVLVTTGEHVLAGQQIGTMGIRPHYLAVHAPFSGTVTAVEQRIHEAGGERHVLAVEIAAAPEQKSAPAVPLSQFSGDRLMFLRDMGVPLDFDALVTARSLMVNCTEFEPTISTRAAIIMNHAEAFAGGLRHLMAATGHTEITLLVHAAERELGARLKAIADRVRGVRLTAVARAWPDTLQPLMSFRQRLSGQAAPAVIVGPGQVFAVYEALELGQPYIRQLVSIAGSAVPAPQTVWLHAGTPLVEILRRAGVSFPFAGRVALGGPMMGGPRYSLEAGIGKKVRGLFAAAGFILPDERKSRFYQSCACIRCGKCVEVCPAGITPIAVVEQVKFHDLNRSLECGLLSCLECGLCAYVCPSQLPLVEIIKLGKLQTRGRESLLIFNIFKTLSS
ncbi:MAG: 4Fe-4S dicluster domain-containing protein [Deltaproteobacteria bacterium]|nr:4Fe-4S dicluster domain-containing protein [Deltaproteobacteria bacterium]